MGASSPHLTLAHIHDIIWVWARPSTRSRIASRSTRTVSEDIRLSRGHKNAGGTLLSNIFRKIFANLEAKPLHDRQLTMLGPVLTVDLSDIESPRINNQVMTESLHGIHLQQDESHTTAERAD